jgi:hypothetical protein
MKRCVQNWWKKHIILSPVSVRTYCCPVFQFSQCDIWIYALVVLNVLWYRI